MSAPTQLKEIQVNGVNIHYLDEGSGDPVVFVHGGGATDYRTWIPVVGPFAERYRVIAPSLRCHYPNEWRGVGSDYSLPDSAWAESSNFSCEDAKAITPPALLLRGDSSPKQFLLAN